MRKVLAVTILLAGGATAAGAVPFVPPVYVGVTGGTLGIGPEIGYTLNPFFGVRASATFLGFKGHGTSAGFRYSGKARISNWGGTVDVYPLTGLGGLRVSAGARVTSGNRIRFTGRATGPRTYSGVVFTPEQAGTLSGTIRTRDVSPMLSVGYARRIAGFSFGIDGGVLFHGTPRPRDFRATGELATNPAAQAEYLSQQQRVRDEVDGYKYYPVLQASLGYRF